MIRQIYRVDYLKGRVLIVENNVVLFPNWIPILNPGIDTSPKTGIWGLQKIVQIVLF